VRRTYRLRRASAQGCGAPNGRALLPVPPLATKGGGPPQPERLQERGSYAARDRLVRRPPHCRPRSQHGVWVRRPPARAAAPAAATRAVGELWPRPQHGRGVGAEQRQRGAFTSDRSAPAHRARNHRRPRRSLRTTCAGCPGSSRVAPAARGRSSGSPRLRSLLACAGCSNTPRRPAHAGVSGHLVDVGTR